MSTFKPASNLFKLFILIFLANLLFSCSASEKNQEKEKEENLRIIKRNIWTYIFGKVKESPEHLFIDSIAILKIDTLNEKLDSMAMVYSYLDKIKDVSEYRQGLIDDLYSDSEILKVGASLGINVDFYKKNTISKLELSRILQDESNKILTKVKSIDSLIRENKYDTVSNTGYLVLSKVFAHDINMSNKNIDSLYLPLDLNFLINDKLIQKKTFLTPKDVVVNSQS